MTVNLLLPEHPAHPVGFWGRILHVDLSSGSIDVQTVPVEDLRADCGGGLLGVCLLLDLTPPGLDALSADAVLIFASSVVAGHRAVALPRFSVVAKSPLTGGVGEARAEGPWGIALKESGVDAIVIRGRALTPRYLLVNRRKVSLEDASGLWGRDTAMTTDVLCDRHGDDAQVATIGVAGEQAVRFASVVSSRTFPAPRMGLGAVMGAKRLKAIVLTGGEPPAVADETRLRNLSAMYAERISSNPLTRRQHDPPGFGAWPLGDGTIGYLGVENYRTSRVPEQPRARPEDLVARLSWDGGCPGCPNRCIKGFRSARMDRGRTSAAHTGGINGSLDDRAGGLHQESLAALGPNLGVWDVDTPLQLNARCHLWGVDPVSLGFTISFLFEVVERGFTTTAVRTLAGGGFGDTDAVLSLARLIAERREPVAWLADGVHRAARHLRADSRRYALEVKGLEMVSFDPRASAGQALAYAVSPIGPRYDIVEHDIDFDPIDGNSLFIEQAAALGVTGPMPMATLDEQKIHATHALMNYWSALDALDICIFAAPPTRALSPADVTDLVGAVTGWEVAHDDVVKWGVRRLNLMRVYNQREGLTAADDRLPDRFFHDPIDAGRHRGVVLDRREFAAAIRLYYSLMDWDELGTPRHDVGSPWRR